MTTLSPDASVRLAGRVHAADAIYSPYGYARSVFGNNIDSVNYHTDTSKLLESETSDGKTLFFKMVHKIKFRSVESWMNRLITDTDDNITWYVIDEKGQQHRID